LSETRTVSEGAPDVLHDLAAVEAALGRLWQAQATPDDPESAPPVMRAATFNLVVVAPSEAEGQAAANVLAAVGAEHPGRVLIVCAVSEAAAAPLEAWVAMHCRAIGGGAQVCGEHVVIVKRGEPERLAGLVTPLLLPDCPVIAWWRGGPGPAAQILDRLALDALLLDGARFEPGELRRWVARFGDDGRTPLGDLAWERTTDWRRWTADAFEPAELREACWRIRSVAVACGRDTAMDGLLYVGWLASRLDWRRGSGGPPGVLQGPGGPVTVTITPGGDGTGLEAVTLETGDPDPLRVTMRRAGMEVTRRREMLLRAVGRPREADEVQLVGRWLDRLGIDATYRDALAASAVVAR
jgi:glucose-6-phosphate dehydrogenase assembly protein OpcA